MDFKKSITFYLILLNFVVFIIQGFIPNYENILGLVPSQAIFEGQIWQFLTYMFTHGSFAHLFFNMFALFMFGPTIEMEFGEKKFILFYLLCGFGSALLHLGLSFGLSVLTNTSFVEMNIPLIGASGAIFGLLTAFAIMFPKRTIFVYFIPMPAKFFIIIYALIELFSGISGIQTGIAHFGHLGGIITAAILFYMFNFRKIKKDIEFIWEYI